MTSGEKPLRARIYNEKDRRVHNPGLVSVLRQLYDDVGAAVFAAYG